MLTHGLQPPPLAVILTNSEPLYSYQRQTIAEAFGCPVRNTYGMVEIVCGATECEHGSLHHWPETGVIEVLQDESSQPVPIGQSGRFVCTGLLNTDMPLIRYQFGDRGALARADSVCGCGRTLPGIARIDGREADLLLTPDGRRLWGEAVTDRFNEYAFPIDGVQLVQERIEAVRVCIVPRASYTARDGERIIAMLRERLGNMQIDLELIDAIPRTANGKVLALVNKMPNGQVQQLVSAPQSEQKE
jgi:phenylacetate-CoA ligase